MTEHINEQICKAIAKVDLIHPNNCYAPPFLIVQHIVARLPSNISEDSSACGLPFYIQLIAQKVASFEEDDQARWDLRRAARTKLCELLVDHHGRSNAVSYFYHYKRKDLSLDVTRDVIVAAIALHRLDIVHAYLEDWKESGLSNGFFPSPIALAGAEFSHTEFFDQIMIREKDFDSVLQFENCDELALAWVSDLANDASASYRDHFEDFNVLESACESSNVVLEKAMKHVMHRGSGDFRLLREAIQEHGIWREPPADGIFLHTACYMGQTLAVAAALKARQFDINRPIINVHYGAHGNTALFIAASRGQTDLVRFLLSKGAGTRFLGCHVLEKIAMGGYVTTLQALFDLSAKSILEADILYALRIAAVRGHEAFVDCLLRLCGVSKAQEWKQDVETWLPLVRNNQYDGVARLLEKWVSQEKPAANNVLAWG